MHKKFVIIVYFRLSLHFSMFWFAFSWFSRYFKIFRKLMETREDSKPCKWKWKLKNQSRCECITFRTSGHSKKKIIQKIVFFCWLIAHERKSSKSSSNFIWMLKQIILHFHLFRRHKTMIILHISTQKGKWEYEISLSQLRRRLWYPRKAKKAAAAKNIIILLNEIQWTVGRGENKGDEIATHISSWNLFRIHFLFACLMLTCEVGAHLQNNNQTRLIREQQKNIISFLFSFWFQFSLLHGAMS